MTMWNGSRKGGGAIATSLNAGNAGVRRGRAGLAFVNTQLARWFIFGVIGLVIISYIVVLGAFRHRLVDAVSNGPHPALPLTSSGSIRGPVVPEQSTPDAAQSGSTQAATLPIDDNKFVSSAEAERRYRTWEAARRAQEDAVHLPPGTVIAPKGGAQTGSRREQAARQDSEPEYGATRMGDEHFTQMTCHLQDDETETCVFENALCFDGKHAVVSVPWDAPPMSVQERKDRNAHVDATDPVTGVSRKSDRDTAGIGVVLDTDPFAACYDFRYYEATSHEYTQCRYFSAFERPLHRHDPLRPSFRQNTGMTALAHDLVSNLKEELQRFEHDLSPEERFEMANFKSAVENMANAPDGFDATPPSVRPDILDDTSVLFRHPETGFPLPVGRKRWGPQNRGPLYFREVPGDLLAPDASRYMLRHPGAKAHVTTSRAWRTETLSASAQRAMPIDADSLVAAKTEEAVLQYHQPQLIARDVHEYVPAYADGTHGAPSNVTIDWLDGPLWIVHLDPQYSAHVYHWATRVLTLFDAQRNNASHKFGHHPNDGFLQPLSADNYPLDMSLMTREYRKVDREIASRARKQEARQKGRALLAEQDVSADGSLTHPGMRPQLQHVSMDRTTPTGIRYRLGGQWRLPSMDYVAFSGDGAPFQHVGKLGAHMAGMLTLSAQPHTRFFGRNVTSRYGATHLMCAKRGVITSTKNRFFGGRAAAWMFRHYAYDYAGLLDRGILPHPGYPPPKITVITRLSRLGRHFDNDDELIAELRATGLQVEVVQDMGRLSFKQQIAKMAGTGILVAAHGAALVNSIFLPQHAAIVEVFPYLMKKQSYFHAAAGSGLFYFPVYNWERPKYANVNETYWTKLLGDPAFIRTCEHSRMSTMDMLLHFTCNEASKRAPIVVPMHDFRVAIRNAIDVIGAGSSTSQEYWSRRPEEGPPRK